MITPRIFAVLLSIASLTSAAQGAEEGTLDPHLEPLRPWLGKTWKAEPTPSKDGKPKIDIARWERALNGKAVRILHSIDDGSYGGETIARWDETKKSIVYHYFTTAGFMTTGTMTLDGGKMTTHETVSGSAGGITEVRGTAEAPTGGTFRLKTEYLKDGKWEPGRDAVYREDATASVVFK